MGKRLFFLTILVLLALTACGTDTETKVSQTSTASGKETSESDSKDELGTEEKTKLSYEVNGKLVEIDAKVITTTSGYNVTVPEHFGLMENEYEGIDEIFTGKDRDPKKTIDEMFVIKSFDIKTLEQAKKDHIQAMKIGSNNNEVQEIDLSNYPVLSNYNFYLTSSQNDDMISSNYYELVKLEEDGRVLALEFTTDIATEDENVMALIHAMAATLEKADDTASAEENESDKDEKEVEPKKASTESNGEIDYNGKWIDRNNSRFLTIEDYTTNKANIYFDYCWNNCTSIGSTDLMEVEFSSNKGTLEYEDDGFGNSGKVLIEIDANQIIIQHNDEEKLTLTKYQPS
ncbi:hypothetical protein [Bacillus coreaensis]